MVECSQCGKPAFVRVGAEKVPLCIDCYSKFQRATQMEYERLVSLRNHYIDVAESLTGYYGVLPRQHIPKPVVYQGPITEHHIQVDNSIVGVVNSGDIHNLEITMDYAKNSDQRELAALLKAFTEAVTKEALLTAEAKKDVVEELSHVSSQAAQPKECRKTGIAKALINSVGTAIQVSAALVTLWDKLKPMLYRALGID